MAVGDVIDVLGTRKSVGGLRLRFVEGWVTGEQMGDTRLKHCAASGCTH